MFNHVSIFALLGLFQVIPPTFHRQTPGGNRVRTNGWPSSTIHDNRVRTNGWPSSTIHDNRVLISVQFKVTQLFYDSL